MLANTRKDHSTPLYKKYCFLHISAAKNQILLLLLLLILVLVLVLVLALALALVFVLILIQYYSYSYSYFCSCSCFALALVFTFILILIVLYYCPWPLNFTYVKKCTPLQILKISQTLHISQIGICSIYQVTMSPELRHKKHNNVLSL